MEAPDYKIALIVGAGEGLSASLARLFASNGMKVALAARQTGKLAALARDTGAQAFACDAARQGDVEQPPETETWVAAELPPRSPSLEGLEKTARQSYVAVGDSMRPSLVRPAARTADAESDMSWALAPGLAWRSAAACASRTIW